MNQEPAKAALVEVLDEYKSNPATVFQAKRSFLMKKMAVWASISIGVLLLGLLSLHSLLLTNTNNSPPVPTQNTAPQLK